MSKKKKPRFHCKTEAQKKAIKISYAKRRQEERIEAPYPHFRYYRKSKHPALIVGEQKGTKTNKQGDTYEIDEYRYRKVMHGEKEGGRTNEILFPNPDPNDPDPMCIAKRVRHDEKDNFENKPLSWRYPKK